MEDVLDPEVSRDILSDAFKANPHPTYRVWHQRERTWYDDRQKYWVAFQYEVVNQLLRDPRLTVERYDHIPNEDERVYDEKVREMLSIWMLNNDGESHKTARDNLKWLFTTKALADYEDLIREQVDQYLSILEQSDGYVESYANIAFPLPAQVVMSILGLGNLATNRLDDLQRYSDVVSTYVGSAGRAPGCIKPTHDVLEEFCEMIMEELANRGPDFDKSLTARLIEIYGDGTTREELHKTLSNIILFIVSGFETTTNLILNTFLALGRNPGLEDELRANPESIDDFVDETLRVYPPVNRTARKAIDTIEIDGATIRPNELVILFMGAANRDPLIYPDPDAFKVDRPERRKHKVLSFGSGPHLCIGRLLSLMELRIFYQEFFKRFSRLEVDLDSVAYRDNSILKGVERLYIRGH